MNNFNRTKWYQFNTRKIFLATFVVATLIAVVLNRQFLSELLRYGVPVENAQLVWSPDTPAHCFRVDVDGKFVLVEQKNRRDGVLMTLEFLSDPEHPDMMLLNVEQAWKGIFDSNQVTVKIAGSLFETAESD